MSITEDFATGLYALSQKELAPGIVHQVKRCLADYLACVSLGVKLNHEKSQALMKGLNPGKGRVSLIACGQKSSLSFGVFMNGIHAHVAEMDDGTRFGMMHPGAPVISAVLGIVQERRLGPEALLKGIVLGYEGAIRLARAIQPSHKERGYHATATCGAVGAAIGVSVALGHSREQLQNALVMAAIGAGGLLKVIEGPSELKPVNSGRAAQLGLESALLAEAKFLAPQEVFTGKNGFFAAMASEWKPELLTEDLAGVYSIEKIYVKPYSACRHCHAPIEAALNIMEIHQLDITSIDKIEVETYHLAVAGHDHVAIDGVSSAKMSIPYSVAAALRFRSGSLDSFKPKALRDQEVQRLTSLVKVKANESYSRHVPQLRIAQLTVHCGDQEYTNQVDLPKGEPENPLRDEELWSKMESLIIHGRGNKQEAQKIRQAVEICDQQIKSLLGLL